MPAKLVIGMDDSGRGSIAGPLVLAALWHPEPPYLQRIGATDSKRTDGNDRRKFLNKLIKDGRGQWGFGAAGADWINQRGTDTAEANAVRSTFEDLAQKLDVPFGGLKLLMDGHKSYPNLPKELEVVYTAKGDRYVPLIAGASMLAKALHDKVLAELAEQYPGWDLDVNGGRPTEIHLLKLYHEGLQPFHRSRAAKTAVCTYALKKGMPVPTWITGAEERDR